MATFTVEPKPSSPTTGQPSTLGFPQLVLRALWILLVLAMTIFVSYRFGAFSQGSATPADVVVLLVWIALLIAPLFQEVSIFGVRLTREMRALRDEVREQVWSIRNDVNNSMVVRSEVNPSFVFGNVLSDADLDKLAERMGKELGPRWKAGHPEDVATPSVPLSTQYLFAVRYALDRELGRLAAFLPFSTPEGRFSPMSVATRLAEREYLDRASLASLRQVYQICSAAIHGARVSDGEIRFVEKVGSGLTALLSSIEAPS